MSAAEDALKEVERRLEARRAAERALAAAVGRARHERATWGEIGQVLGVTRQSAQEKYGKLIVK